MFKQFLSYVFPCTNLKCIFKKCYIILICWFSAEEHEIHQTHFFLSFIYGIKNVFSVNCVWLCMVKHSSFWCARLSIIYTSVTCKKKNCCVIFYTFIDMNWPCLSSICIFLLINLSFEYVLTSILANQEKVWRSSLNPCWVDV